MPCYLAEFEYIVDAQRRLAIPSAWRAPDPAENRFVLLPGREQSLHLVPYALFQELVAKLRTVSFADAKAALALASIGSMAAVCQADRQGRIMLTAKLMSYAGITDRAVLVGAVTAIQVWRPEAWRERCMDSHQGLDVIQALQERPDDLMSVLQKVVRPSS
jgi:MraZ protein